MSAADPRYPADGLADLIDALEERIGYEAWRPRYLLGFDGSRAGDVVVLDLTTGRLQTPTREERPTWPSLVSPALCPSAASAATPSPATLPAPAASALAARHRPSAWPPSR